MRTSCSYNVKILEVGLMGYELRDVIQNGIIEELPVQVMLLNEEREIEWANQEILDYTDLEYDKIIGKTCFEIFHDRKEPCEEYFTNSSKKQKKLSVFLKEEKEKRFLVRCKHIKDGIKGLLVVRVEISDYLKKSKKEEFLHSLLKHDLNNKLQINEGYLELMKDEGKLTKEQKKYWQRALKSAKDGIDLINKVKTALKVKDAKTKKINISPILSKTLSQLDYELKKQDIDTEFDLNSCYIKGGELLEEVFYNLINNSIKHSSCNKIRIYIEHWNEECIFVYEDDGCGVDKKHMNRLFEEGFTTGNGSGLGLYLVKEIINTYGGSIKPTTAESGGLRFNIKLKKVD